MVDVLTFSTFPSFLLVFVSFEQHSPLGIPYLSGLNLTNGEIPVINVRTVRIVPFLTSLGESLLTSWFIGGF